jgi:UDP-N-acetylglucosamine--N-acetylmuramyl-(pentapeptide) pyrophosphoryl-undecaprenol N-acetylglucosamine transferase
MALPGNLWQIGKGIFAARSILNRFRPQVIFFTGGYLAVPVALACRLPGWRTPRPKNLLYVPDIEPGLALRFLARLADQIALTTEESMGYFADQSIVTVTGYPTRPGLRSWTRQAARNAFALAPELPTLLVFGGSKGARSINRALFSILPQLLPEMQIVHVTGHLDWPEVDSIRRSLGTGWSNRYHAYPYLYKEMGAALATADLVLSRAGASILGEYPLFGLPAILVPYPYAWRYQEVNARYLSDKGAAIVLADGDLDSKLLPTIQMLMRDRTQRDVMQDTMQSLARPNASGSIAGLICSLAPLTGAGRM